MSTTTFESFTTKPIDRRIDFYSVNEGDSVIASCSTERPYLATMGLFICKAIAIYSPTAQKGLLAHLSNSRLLGLDMEGLVRRFGVDDFEKANVQVVETQQSTDLAAWPSSETIAEVISGHGPANISIDHNINGFQIRGVALDLADGTLYEIDPETADEWHGSVDFSRNIPIDPLSNLR